MKLFNEDLSDKSLIYIQKSSKTLVIPFTAWYNKETGLIRFDWNIFRKFDVDILFLRDLHLSWYLRGIKGKTNNVADTVKFLERYTKRYDKVITIGSSMGGYASLLFGSLIKHPNIHVKAFSPQTNLTQWGRCEDRIRLLDNHTPEDYHRYSVLGTSVTLPLTTTIYYGKLSGPDVRQMSQVDCEQITFETEQHAVAQWLHNRDELIPLVETFI